MKKFVFSILLNLYAALSFPQQIFQRIMVEDGLTNNIAFGAVQDNKSFMWFATMSGIDRFDGKSLVHYRLPNDKNEQDLNYGQVITIVKDADGALWTSTSSRLYKYNPRLDRFEIVLKYETYVSTVTSIFADSFNSIWIGSNKGLFRYDSLKKKIIVINGTSGQRWAFNEDVHKSIWVACAKYITKFTYSQQSKNYLPISIKTPIKAEPASLFIDEKNLLWLGSVEKVY